MKICITLLLAAATCMYAVHGVTDDCNENQARLGPADDFSHVVPGGDVQGFLEVCEDSEWKFICDGDWTLADATVACRQLGYGAAASNGTVGILNPTVLSYTPQCSGTEQDLSSCMTIPHSGQCSLLVAISCWNRSQITTTATTLATTSVLTLSTTSSSHVSSKSSSRHHNMHPTVTSQPPVETFSTASPATSAHSTAGVDPVVYGAVAAVATVVILSAAVLVVCVLWKLAKSRRRHTPSAGVEVRELEANSACQTQATAHLIPPNDAHVGSTVITQHSYEDNIIV